LKVAKELGNSCGENGRSIDVLGPAPAPVSMIRNNYRWHLVIKAPSYDALRDALRGKSAGNSGGVREIIDVDPYNML
jgi:primosomal protein N' (replication factor Y)